MPRRRLRRAGKLRGTSSSCPVADQLPAPFRGLPPVASEREPCKLLGIARAGSTLRVIEVVRHFFISHRTNGKSLSFSDKAMRNDQTTVGAAEQDYITGDFNVFTYRSESLARQACQTISLLQFVAMTPQSFFVDVSVCMTTYIPPLKGAARCPGGLRS